MPKINFDIAVDEVWWILKEHNGIPSGKVDRAAYAKVLYYLKTYSHTPQIKALIKEFNLAMPKTKAKRTSGIEEIKRILEERGRMPRLPDEEQLYHKVKYFFKKNGGDEEVKRLKMIYASGDCCPLYEKEPNNYVNNIQPYKRILASLDYVVMTFEHYHVFPAENTVPMKLVRHLFENPSTKYTIGKLFDVSIPDHVLNSYLTKLIDLGCEDEMVIDNWNKLN